jgi:hypothetical protein
MHNPFDQAAGVYDREPCARTFDDDLVAHLRFGYVFSTPEYFIMGRPVDSQSEDYLLLNPSLKFERTDAWLVWLYAGDIQQALNILPIDLPYVLFQRKNELRRYSLARFKNFLAYSVE